MMAKAMQNVSGKGRPHVVVVTLEHPNHEDDLECASLRADAKCRATLRHCYRYPLLN